MRRKLLTVYIIRHWIYYLVNFGKKTTDNVFCVFCVCLYRLVSHEVTCYEPHLSVYICRCVCVQFRFH